MKERSAADKPPNGKIDFRIARQLLHVSQLAEDLGSIVGCDSKSRSDRGQRPRREAFHVGFDVRELLRERHRVEHIGMPDRQVRTLSHREGGQSRLGIPGPAWN